MGFPPNILAPPPKSLKKPILADFLMQNLFRESAPLVPREWSYEAENLQLYIHMGKYLRTCHNFFARGLTGSAGPPNVNLGRP